HAVPAALVLSCIAAVRMLAHSSAREDRLNRRRKISDASNCMEAGMVKRRRGLGGRILVS
ncbi:MAG: hypothetical protein WA774_03260, partial [Candidatus Acidiferrales bacterium]